MQHNNQNGFSSVNSKKGKLERTKTKGENKTSGNNIQQKEHNTKDTHKAQNAQGENRKDRSNLELRW